LRNVLNFVGEGEKRYLLGRILLLCANRDSGAGARVGLVAAYDFVPAFVWTGTVKWGTGGRLLVVEELRKSQGSESGSSQSNRSGEYAGGATTGGLPAVLVLVTAINDLNHGDIIEPPSDFLESWVANRLKTLNSVEM
jgi:hypothetical protein